MLVTAWSTAPSPAIGAPVVLENRLPGTPCWRTSESGSCLSQPLAHAAYARFGRGPHAAALNFGDCLCHAVARAADEPPLCVGDDFPKTELPLLRWPYSTANPYPSINSRSGASWAS